MDTVFDESLIVWVYCGIVDALDRIVVPLLPICNITVATTPTGRKEEEHEAQAERHCRKLIGNGVQFKRYLSDAFWSAQSKEAAA